MNRSLKFDSNNSGYKRCSYCDIQLKDSRLPYFIEHLYENKSICMKHECLKEYVLETHSRFNFIEPIKGNPFK
tara:strand:- start:112 stop:330 length:219 start_codon:yes stop_codon:yes gene_type:complete